MNTKRLCVAILSCLFFYGLFSVLFKAKGLRLRRINNGDNAQFIQDGVTANVDISLLKNDGQRVTNTQQPDIARVASRQLSPTQKHNKDKENTLKYNTSLSPDFYAIKRPPETLKSKPPELDQKSIAELEADARMAMKRGKTAKLFPTTLIIGVRKAGTRALLAMLRLHPQIKSCGPEVHYFDRRFPRGLQWYLDKTPAIHRGQQTIEKTPSYFVVRGVPERVLEYSKAINKSLKLLVVFRDPTVRAVSDYVQLSLGVKAKYNTILKPFETLVMKNESTLEVNTSWNVIKTGVYSKHLERWLRHFPLSWFYFVSGEQLVINPFKEVKKVEQFLGLKPYFSKSNFVFNPEKGFPCFRGGSTENARCLGNTKGRAHPNVDPRTLSELRRYYRPFNKHLYKMVGRNFQWR